MKSLYIFTDSPYMTEYISDGYIKICRWSTGLIIGYAKSKGTWVSKSDFQTWREAEHWYKTTYKDGGERW